MKDMFKLGNTETHAIFLLKNRDTIQLENVEIRMCLS